MLSKYPELFKDHGSSYPIYNLHLPFADYIQQTRKIVADTRRDLQQNAEKIIDANSPFEFRPSKLNSKQGVLLIHGLLDCPFQMHEIGMRLYQKGLLVRGILLPGHGTVPGDLLNVKMETWLQAVEYGIKSLAKDVDTVNLVGFSTGASLGLYHALKDPSLFSKLVLLSPVFKIQSYLDFCTNWFSLLGGYWKRASWLTVAPEIDYAKYQSLPFNAVYQVYRLTEAIKKISQSHPPINPLLFILSQADGTVSAKATLNYFKQYDQKQNKLILYTSPVHKEKNAQIDIRSAEFPEFNIHHFSHICLPISPDNPHYGLQGDYVDASRAKENNYTIYGSFNKLENKIYQYLFQKKIVKMQHSRLTFNPDFEYMIKQIENFLEI